MSPLSILRFEILHQVQTIGQFEILRPAWLRWRTFWALRWLALLPHARLPAEEKAIGPLLDLYFLAENLQVTRLSVDVVEAVRTFYHDNGAYPGLRRVQYVYANTEDDNPMREMMVGSVARFLALADTIPAHWERALKKNGQLAVDIIRSIQEWHLEDQTVPDARDASLERGRARNAVGFSEVEELKDVKEEELEEMLNGETKVNGNVWGEIYVSWFESHRMDKLISGYFHWIEEGKR